MTEPAEHARPERVTVVTNEGGLRFTSEIRGHRVPTDQPERAGGADDAVTPLELLSASLGSCIALYAHQFCAAREIPVEGLRVEVRTETARAPGRIARFDVRLFLPADVPEQYMPALERAVQSCPVHNTLTHPPEITLDLVAPAVL
jgi:putative redox protein